MGTAETIVVRGTGSIDEGWFISYNGWRMGFGEGKGRDKEKGKTMEMESKDQNNQCSSRGMEGKEGG